MEHRHSGSSSVKKFETLMPTIKVRLLEPDFWDANDVLYKEFLTKGFTVNCDSDEAHFWLNGYVNKQNCRIWSEANPQVYVETPLHPEKLTVWCALWASGILLQKR
ncbi:hypothetical protein TNCV_5033981 [Trichonephila clavipes]|nr:hypothetical protein TNCV_5033981 [Trichonephila clavipes]